MQLDEQVQLARLKALHGACALRRLERNSTAREHLAEGLHLIDFEQLKIENQSLNERIEEKNEQLLALRKKTTQNVLVLSHLKEKLQFVERQGGKLQVHLGWWWCRVITAAGCCLCDEAWGDHLR